MYIECEEVIGVFMEFSVLLKLYRCYVGIWMCGFAYKKTLQYTFLVKQYWVCVKWMCVMVTRIVLYFGSYYAMKTKKLGIPFDLLVVVNKYNMCFVLCLAHIACDTRYQNRPYLKSIHLT